MPEGVWCANEGESGRPPEVLGCRPQARLSVRKMEQDKLTAINRYIRDAAQQAADIGSISGPAIERFLRTGEETWDGAGSGRFTLAQIKQDEIYSERAKAALRTLFALLTNLLPLEAKRVPPVAPETIRQHVDPMVKGLV